MTRVLLVREPGTPVPAPDDRTTVAVLDLPPAGLPTPAATRTLEAVRTSCADAIVLALPDRRAGPEQAAFVQLLLDTARVPSVLGCPHNLYGGAPAADRDALAAALGRATAVLHGFGARTVELALQAAVRLAQPRPGT